MKKRACLNPVKLERETVVSASDFPPGSSSSSTFHSTPVPSFTAAKMGNAATSKKGDAAENGREKAKRENSLETRENSPYCKWSLKDVGRSPPPVFSPLRLRWGRDRCRRRSCPSVGGWRWVGTASGWVRVRGREGRKWCCRGGRLG